MHFEVCHSGNLPLIVNTGGRRAGAAAAVDDRDVRIQKCCVRIVPRIQTTDPRTGGIRNWGHNPAVKTHRLLLPQITVITSESYHVCVSVCL